MSHERRFPFPNGDDKAYIRYLEELVIMGQVLKTHQLTGPVSQQKWMRQLDHFTENILKLVASDDAWNERRQSSGVATPARNATALNLILGCQVNAIYADNLPAGNPVLAPSPSGDYHDLVLNGYRYGEFMISCKEDRDFAKTVVAFQNLVFCSYCLVISEIMKSKGSGADKSTPAINKMMRAYLDGSQDDKTLRKYRGGAKWYNRCMATLLANGWGYKAWEIFLLEKRSLSMFGCFNDSDAGSDGLLSARVGFGRVPCSEPGWMPYCLPCIVHFLTGPTVELSQICDILGYGAPDEPPLQPVRVAFDQAIHQLLNPSVPTG